MDSLLLVGGVIALLVGWRVSRWLWYHGPCRRCGGSGKSWGSNSKRWGYCRRCGGSGARRRFGAKRED